jgi:hypothetical protein
MLPHHWPVRAQPQHLLPPSTSTQPNCGCIPHAFSHSCVPAPSAFKPCDWPVLTGDVRSTFGYCNWRLLGPTWHRQVLAVLLRTAVSLLPGRLPTMFGRDGIGGR